MGQPEVGTMMPTGPILVDVELSGLYSDKVIVLSLLIVFNILLLIES